MKALHDEDVNTNKLNEADFNLKSESENIADFTSECGENSQFLRAALQFDIARKRMTIMVNFLTWLRPKEGKKMIDLKLNQTNLK
jgi:hypothetical protein